MLLFSIYDKVADRYAPPFVAVNAGVACRQLENSIREVPEIHLVDFELVQIGTFDEVTGNVASDMHSVVARGVDFKKNVDTLVP